MLELSSRQVGLMANMDLSGLANTLKQRMLGTGAAVPNRRCAELFS